MTYLIDCCYTLNGTQQRKRIRVYRCDSELHAKIKLARHIERLGGTGFWIEKIEDDIFYNVFGIKIE